MFKKIGTLLTILMLAFYIIPSFAISPGAGQAQMRNNMQEMQQNQKRMQQMRKQMIQQQETKTLQSTPRNYKNAMQEFYEY